jgi:hypothetical protein
MTTATLTELAHRHRDTAFPLLNIKGLVADQYGVGYRYFFDVERGTRKPSAKLLRGIARAHVRLFPHETVILSIPNHPPIVLGDPTNLNTSN